MNDVFHIDCPNSRFSLFNIQNSSVAFQASNLDKCVFHEFRVELSSVSEIKFVMN